MSLAMLLLLLLLADGPWNGVDAVCCLLSVFVMDGRPLSGAHAQNGANAVLLLLKNMQNMSIYASVCAYARVCMCCCACVCFILPYGLTSEN